MTEGIKVHYLPGVPPQGTSGNSYSDIITSSLDVTNDNGMNLARFAGGRRCMILVSNVGGRRVTDSLEDCLTDFQATFSKYHTDCHVHDAFRVLPMSSALAAPITNSMMIEAFITPRALQHGALSLVDEFEKSLRARFPKATFMRQDTRSPKTSSTRYIQHTEITPVNRSIVRFPTGASEHEQ